jgi:hypothetical protein
MPSYIAGDVGSHENLLAIDTSEFEKKRNTAIFTGSEVTTVDFGAMTVVVLGDDDPCTDHPHYQQPTATPGPLSGAR